MALAAELAMDDPTSLFALPEWTQVNTELWLSVYPLPTDFTWPDRYNERRAVLPAHRKLKGGYGKWLHETPYFPGLFEKIHEILVRAPLEVEMTPEWLVGELEKLRTPSTQTNI